MCYEPQPMGTKCSCGHLGFQHEDVGRPLLSENGEGACSRCSCQRNDALPPRQPRWIFYMSRGQAETMEVAIRRAELAEAMPKDRNESYYRDLLAKQVGGRTEVTLPFGRADVMTDAIVWEVEPVSRWTEGVAQALQYAAQVPQRGAIAIYGDGVPRAKVRAKLASLPAPGLELWWLEGGQFARLEA